MVLQFRHFVSSLSREGMLPQFGLDFVRGLTDINLLWYESQVRSVRQSRQGLARIECRKLTSNHQGGCVSGTDIFLSYARRDRPTARVIAECLSDEGLSVWWDASLHSGETFDEVIERNLKDAKAVVVLWSPASVASRWVRAEATLADRRNKLVPAIIEACDRPIIFELTHTAELTDWKGDRSDVRWRTFIEDLYRLIKAASDQSGASREIEEVRSEQVTAPETGRISGGIRSTRQPLRPGSQEVIISESARRSSPLHPATSAAITPAPENDVHCLEIEPGELPSELIVIGSGGVKIGRTRPADIVLPHRSISREHCIIGVANDELLVTDLNSTNGTFIDDVRINRATILPVGSVLRLGEVSMRHALQTDGQTRQGGRLRGGGGSGHVGHFAAAS